MFVLGKKDSNFADIRSIEYAILERNPDVKVVMKTADALQKTSFLNEDKRLIM